MAFSAVKVQKIKNEVVKNGREKEGKVGVSLRDTKSYSNKTCSTQLPTVPDPSQRRRSQTMSDSSLF